MNAFRVPAIIFLFVLAASMLVSGWGIIAFPAFLLGIWLASSDASGKGIDGIFSLFFGFIVVGGGLVLVWEILKAIFG